MRSEAVLVEKERTNQKTIEQLTELLKSPLFQALICWLIVEYCQKNFKFGTITGTVLEGATVIRLFDIEKLTSDMNKITTSLAPLIASGGVK